MLFAIDVETECTVEGCVDHGKALCRNNHSLSPWHSRITVAAVVGENGFRHVYRDEPGHSIAKQIEFDLCEVDQPYDWKVTGQNFKFDWLHLARHGFEIPLERWQHDTQLAAFVLTEKIPDWWLEDYERKRMALGGHHRKAGKHSLKTLAPYFLGCEPFWEPEDGNLDSDDYVLKDTEYTLELTRVLEAKLKELGQYEFYRTKQLEWTKMLLMAEWRGVELDTEELDLMEGYLSQKADELKEQLDSQWAKAHDAYAKRKRDELHTRYTDMTIKALRKIKDQDDEDRCHAVCRRYERLLLAALEKENSTAVDYDSPSQMAWLLRDYLGYDISSLEGKDSTAAEVLERLAEDGHADVKTYLEWRETNKLLTAFIPSYRELAVPDRLGGAAITGSRNAAVRGGGKSAIHPIYNPTGTRTGRLSAERPNVQQAPGTIKRLIRARDGYSFVGYDEAAIEARLIALYTEDHNLYDILASGYSFHDYNVKGFFDYDTPIGEVKSRHKREREASKNVGFALFYGGGGNRIRIAFAEKGFIFPEAHCKSLFKKFQQRFPQAFEFKQQITKYFEEGGTMPNLLGRPIAIENPEDAYMKGFNKLIQSAASDLVLHGSHLAWQAALASGLDAHPVLFVHDFVGFEVRNEHVAAFDPILRESLTNFDLPTQWGPIKLEVEGGVMTRWEK
jgi:DNA polymerase I-like protein with 3'-5' exonuclease and polymerase domains